MPEITHSTSENFPEIPQKLRALEQRVERLELKLNFAAQPQTAAPVQAMPSPVAPPLTPAPIPVPVVSYTAPSPAPAPRGIPAAPSPAPSSTSQSAESYPRWNEPAPYSAPKPPSRLVFSLSEWENLIGGKWTLWVGSLCLFLAMGWFLAYTWPAFPPPPPWAKVAMGLGSGLALLAGGHFARGRARHYFSEGLSGAGLSICYLSLWAGSQHFTVLSHAQSFLGMALLTALGVGLALRYDALSLSVLSTLGGFLTPLLLNSNASASQSVSLLVYVAFLNSGILVVSLGKRWRGLTWLSFAGTAFLTGGWLLGSFVEPLRLASFGFVTLFFLQFMGASTFYSLIRREETAPEDLLLLFSATSLYTVTGYSLLQPVSVALPCAFPLVLAAFFAILNLATRWLTTSNKSLRLSTGGLALLAVTLAFPLQFQHSALTIGWVTEATILLYMAGQLRSSLLRNAGRWVWILSFVPLLHDMAAPPTTRFGPFSSSALPLTICIAMTAFTAWNTNRQSAENRDDWEPIYTISGVLGGAWLLAQELYRYSQLNWNSFSGWEQNAYLVIASVISLYSLGVFALGLKGQHDTLRWNALVLATTSAAATLFNICHNSFQPTAAKVALHWPASACAFIVVGGVLLTLNEILHKTADQLSDNEKDLPHMWKISTLSFLLLGTSLHLYSIGSINRTLLGPNWMEMTTYGLSIFWSLSAPILLNLGWRSRDEGVRGLAIFTGLAGLCALLLNALTPDITLTPFFNCRILAFVAVIVAGQLMRSIYRHLKDELSDWEEGLPAMLTYLSLFLLLWALTQESYETSRYFQDKLGTRWQRWGQMLISLVWSAYGASLLVGGIHLRRQPLRLAALALLAVAVFKVFLIDLAFLSGMARIVSLAGLGVSLIFISWLYSRYGNENSLTSESAR